MIFFFDRNVGKTVPRVLRILGLKAEAHTAHFARDEDDDRWMAQVGAWGWIVIGHDSKFHKQPNELTAIKQHNVQAFYLWGANATKWEKVQVFARAYDRIIKIARNQPPPFVYQVSRNGRVTEITLP